MENHPSSDQLYVIDVDLGRESPVRVVSGLASYYKAEELVGTLVVVVCNLKASAFKGVKSHGMILCAKQATSVRTLCPETTVPVGSLVTLQGHPYSSAKKFDILNSKKLKEVMIQSDLKTDSQCLARSNGISLNVCNSDVTPIKAVFPDASVF